MKKSETKCKECGFDPAERESGGMMKHRKWDRKLAKDYCERASDSRHTVKPIWKKCCGTLDRYNVIIKDLRKPIWKK